MGDIFIDFEFLRVIDRHLDTQATEFIIHLDSIGLHFEFDPPAFRAFAVIGDGLSLKLWIKFTPKKGKNVSTSEVIECVPDQGWINILQSLTALKHDIGRVLALIHTPVVSLVECFFYGIKIRVHYMCKEIQLAAKAFGIKFIRKFLRFRNIADLEEGIIIHPVMDVAFIKHLLHHLPAIDVDLNEEGEPCLELDMHEAEVFIQKIHVKILAFTVDGNKFQKPIVLFLGLKCLAWFHNRDGTDKALLYRAVIQNSSGGFFFGILCRGKIYQGSVQRLRKGFHMRNDLLGDCFRKSREILRQDIMFRQKMFFSGR